VFNKHTNRRDLKILLPRQSLSIFRDRVWQEVREDASAACLSESLASSAYLMLLLYVLLYQVKKRI